MRVANQRANLKRGQWLVDVMQRVKDKQVKLYGHLIRADSETYRTRRVSIDKYGKRAKADCRRVGRPRAKWYDAVKQEVGPHQKLEVEYGSRGA